MEKRSDNEIIAEFMGLKTKKISLLSDNDLTVYWKDNAKDWFSLPDYDKSWDSLMPVVQAIEDLEEPHPSNNPTKGTVWPYQVEILSRSVVQVIDNRSDESVVLIDEQHHRKIDSVYKAVLQFIHWHNQNKENLPPLQPSNR